MASEHCDVEGALERTTCKGLLAPPMSSRIHPTKGVVGSQWIKPTKILTDAGVPRDPLLPVVKGHYWDQVGRHNLYGTGGPLLWPLRKSDSHMVEDCIVFDPRGPPGMVRKLEAEEVWWCQGRTSHQLQLLHQQGLDSQKALVEGNKATGGHTAMALVLMAGYVDRNGPDRKAGGGHDPLGEEALTKLLEWLGRWRRGIFPRAQLVGDCRAGGRPSAEDSELYEVERAVWRWGEALWLWALFTDEDEGEVDFHRAGGRPGGKAGDKAREACGEAHVHESPVQVRPFDGLVGDRVEEWIEENLVGYHADSTTKQYAGIYGKWKAWSRRQKWHTEYLDKAQRVETNEDKILGFLGYLGWLGCSVATIKQAVFALKDAHKRAGKGNSTEGMYRLWMLLGALDKRSVKKPRRLGVTPEMLRWIKRVTNVDCDEVGDILDAAVLRAAVMTAWFFMLRAKEYCDSNGIDYAMILRGVDVKFLFDDVGGIQVVIGSQCSSGRPRPTRKPLARAKQCTDQVMLICAWWRPSRSSVVWHPGGSDMDLKRFSLCFGGPMALW